MKAPDPRTPIVYPKGGPVRRTSENTRGRILDAAQARFFTHGFSRVTMNDLATDLGMSKKTLYTYFRSKDALLESVAHRFTRGIASEMDRVLLDQSLDFSSRLSGILDALGRRLVLLDKYFIDDMLRHAPQVWQRIEEFRRKRIFRVFGKLFKEGASQGHFRKDLDPGLILQIYFHSIQNILNPRTLSTLPYATGQVFDTLQTVLFEGVLTDKGRSRRATRRRKES